MRIIIETVPHSEQRYPTVGDWQFLAPPFCKEGDLGIMIKVSELGDWHQECLVAVHELVEVLLCKSQGIHLPVVDRFDMEFEAKHREDDLSEPGDDPNAPYKRQHCFATGVERLLAAELGVDWKTYEEKLESL